MPEIPEMKSALPYMIATGAVRPHIPTITIEDELASEVRAGDRLMQVNGVSIGIQDASNGDAGVPVEAVREFALDDMVLIGITVWMGPRMVEISLDPADDVVQLLRR